jgi:hypothetical protein
MARGDITHSPGKGKKIGTFHYDVDQEVEGKIATRKVGMNVYHLSGQCSFQSAVALGGR